MMFRQGLRTGWYSLLKARNFWRMNCSEGLHKDLVMRYIETQLILLSPICPHFCESMWQKIQQMGFPVKGLVVNAGWPDAREFDFRLNQEFEYLQEARHMFQKDFASQDASRLKLNKKKKQNTPPFDSCRVFVADRYLDYQVFVLETLKDMYVEGSIPDSSEYRPIFFNSEFAKNKREKKMIMDFATMIVKDALPEGGAKVLNTTPPFNELETFKKNLSLILGDVKDVPLENIHIYSREDPGKDDPRGMADRAIPMKPKIQFY